MSGIWQQNIAGILGSDGKTIVGTGALVATKQCGLCVLTCAHVLNDARGYPQDTKQRPAGTVFYCSLPGRDGLFEAEVEEWHPPVNPQARRDQPASDVALLKVRSQVPAGVRPYSAKDFKVTDLEDLVVQSFGYATNDGQHRG